MAGRYKSPSRAQEAERRFPIRIRYEIPPHGLGRLDDELNAWLLEHAPDQHGHSSAGLFPKHYAFVHLATPALAIKFLSAWDQRLDIGVFEI